MNNRVFVYRNLRFKDAVMWSLKSVKTGKVTGREPMVYLTDCDFKVSKAGQERVRRERKKYVHAGVQGVPAPMDLGVWLDAYVKVTYNPYKTDTFVRCDTGEAVFKAKKVLINKDGVFAVL